MKNKHSLATTAELAMYVAVAFIFSYIESLIPLPIPFPGIKLGLANLVIVITLFHKKSIAYAFVVGILKNVLMGVTFGNPFTFLYSIAGCLLSILVMSICYHWLHHDDEKTSAAITTSALGGIFHNMGQLAIAMCIVGPSAILPYFPFLYFGGMLSGILIGIVGRLCLRRLPSSLNNTN